MDQGVVPTLLPLLEKDTSSAECNAAATCLANACITRPRLAREVVIDGGIDPLLDMCACNGR